MADGTEKRRRLARDIVQHTTGFRDSLRALLSDGERYADDGIAFADADFTGIQGLEHLTPAKLTLLLANVTTINTFLETNFIDDVIEQVCA